MMRRLTSACVVLCILGGLVSCDRKQPASDIEPGSSATPDQPNTPVQATQVAVSYRSYPRMTERYVPVDPRTAALCRAPLPSDADPAEVLGPHARHASRST